MIHDVALQKLDVTLAIDRAGFVGGDGATHAGIFDVSYLRCIPNMIIMSPQMKTNAGKCFQLDTAIKDLLQFAIPEEKALVQKF